MPQTVAFDDRRPWFVVAVTGHPDLIPGGAWTCSPSQWLSFEPPGAADVRRYLDGVLYRRRRTHQILLRCRETGAGVDEVVRAYAKVRGLVCHPHKGERDLWDEAAQFRADLKMIADSHALVWFGPRESPADGPDPVTLATWLGIPHRVVPVHVPCEEEA